MIDLRFTITRGGDVGYAESLAAARLCADTLKQDELAATGSVNQGQRAVIDERDENGRLVRQVVAR